MIPAETFTTSITDRTHRLFEAVSSLLAEDAVLGLIYRQEGAPEVSTSTDQSVTVDVLSRARDLIAKGWTRGVSTRDGRYCALGAILKASKDLGLLPSGSYAAIAALRSVIYEGYGYKGYKGTIVMFNDAQKTKRPVLAAFDQAIETLQDAVETLQEKK